MSTSPHTAAPPSAAARRTAWLLVLGQFTLLGLVVGLPSTHAWSLPLGATRASEVASLTGVLVMVVAATTLSRGLSAAPLPNDHAQLRTGGLYRYVRHPIYTGLLLFAISRAAGSGSGWNAAACALLIALINVKARWEERRLAERFPGYPAYARHTPRFIPSPTRTGRAPTADRA